MTISIVVPVYGVEKYIEQCARSLMEQTVDDYEVIFVDDCSPDKSVSILQEVLKRYPNRDARIVRLPENLGLGGARLAGFKESKGIYIWNVDGDDWVEPDAVECLLDCTRRTRAAFVGMDFWYEWNKTRKISIEKWSRDSKNYTRMLLSGETMPCVWKHLIKKELMVRNQLLPQVGIDMGEDYVLTPRLAYFATEIAHIDKPLYHYRQVNQNAYTKQRAAKRAAGLGVVLDILGAFFADKEDFAEALHCGQWLKKTELMMAATYDEYPIIDEMRTDGRPVMKTMPIQMRLAALLIYHKQWGLLLCYACTFRLFMRGIQLLKGR